MMYNLTVERPYEHLLSVWQEVLLPYDNVAGKPITIRKALAGDALLLDLREEQKDTFDNTNLDYLIKAHAWLSMITPMNYTIFHGDDILLMASITPVFEGVAEISFLTDKNFVNADRRVKVAMIKSFREATEFLPFRRLQAKVKEGFDIGTNFVERMGMRPEGVLTKYGPEGDNYIMYGKVR